MFGYMSLSQEGLTEEERTRYQAYYCGLCRTLKARHGTSGRVTLSNDMTFLYILLSSLYEPEETEGKARCLPHPIRARIYMQNRLSEYCADMNIALAYHKCLDDWTDDRSLVGKAQAGILHKAYKRVESQYPEKCRAIEECITAIGSVEQEGRMQTDEPANLTARMLGSIFRYQEDYWADSLEAMGEALGRFVYLMDAYDDLAADIRRGRYNPLREYADQPDYEDFCQESLMLLVAECTEVFERLPLVLDVEILRNILYSGIWVRYQAKRQRARQKEEIAVKEGAK